MADAEATSLKALGRHVVASIKGLSKRVVISAIVGFAVAWLANVYVMAREYEGYVVPSGSLATGEGNMLRGGTFWFFASAAISSIISFRLILGGEAFWATVRGAPRVLADVFRADGSRAPWRALWGVSIALVLSLVLGSSISGPIALIAAMWLITLLRPVLVGALLALWNGVLARVLPTREERLDEAAMSSALVGATGALAFAFLIPGRDIRLGLAVLAAIVAFLLMRGASSSPDATTVVVLMAGVAGVLVVLGADAAWADDGGWAECGSSFSSWFNCGGSDHVRELGLAGGAAAAAGAAAGPALAEGMTHGPEAEAEAEHEPKHEPEHEPPPEPEHELEHEPPPEPDPELEGEGAAGAGAGAAGGAGAGGGGGGEGEGEGEGGKADADSKAGLPTGAELDALLAQAGASPKTGEGKGGGGKGGGKTGTIGELTAATQAAVTDSNDTMRQLIQGVLDSLDMQGAEGSPKGGGGGKGGAASDPMAGISDTIQQLMTQVSDMLQGPALEGGGKGGGGKTGATAEPAAGFTDVMQQVLDQVSDVLEGPGLEGEGKGGGGGKGGTGSQLPAADPTLAHQQIADSIQGIMQNLDQMLGGEGGMAGGPKPGGGKAGGGGKSGSSAQVMSGDQAALNQLLQQLSEVPGQMAEQLSQSPNPEP